MNQLHLLFLTCSFCLLSAILEYAVATKQTRLVAHLFSKLDEWTVAWELDVVSTRNLLQNFAAVLEVEGDKSQSLKALIKYFQTYQQESGGYTAEVEQKITTAVLGAINSPVDAFADRVALLEVKYFYLFFISLQNNIDCQI